MPPGQDRYPQLGGVPEILGFLGRSLKSSNFQPHPQHLQKSLKFFPESQKTRRIIQKSQNASQTQTSRKLGITWKPSYLLRFQPIQLLQEGHISLSKPLRKHVFNHISNFDVKNHETCSKLPPKWFPRGFQIQQKSWKSSSGSKGVPRGAPKPGSPKWVPRDPKWSLQAAKKEPPASQIHVFLYKNRCLPEGNQSTAACSPGLLLTCCLLTKGWRQGRSLKISLSISCLSS